MPIVVNPADQAGYARFPADIERASPDPADVACLSPLGHPTIYLQGRYHTTGRAHAGRLRPLRTDC